MCKFGSPLPGYGTSSASIIAMADMLGLLTNEIQGRSNKASNVACLGWSTGTHLCGMASGTMTNIFDKIIAFDPAQALFDTNQPLYRLDKSDARHVEIIYSDTNSFAFERPLGHLNIYVNGGANQPGCLTNVCDHSFSHELLVKIYNGAIDCSEGMYVCEDKDVPKLKRIHTTADMIKRLKQNKVNCKVVEHPIEIGSLEPSNTSGIYWLSTQDKGISKCILKGRCPIMCM